MFQALTEARSEGSITVKLIWQPNDAGWTGSTAPTRPHALYLRERCYIQVRADVTHNMQNGAAINPETVVAKNGLSEPAPIIKSSTSWWATADTTLLTKVYVGTGNEDRTAYWSQTLWTRTVDAHATRPAPAPNTSSGSVRVQLGYLAAPVMLWATEPDPSGNPTLGDNEYVMFGGGQPFRVPCKMWVGNASGADMNFLRLNANWTINCRLPGLLPGTENGSDANNLFPQFYSDYDGPPGTLMDGLGFSTLNGLPGSNNAFGAGTVTHWLAGSPLATADIEIFFISVAFTHPADGRVYWCEPGGLGHLLPDTDNYIDPGPHTPNWFYYYSQAWSNPWGTTVSYEGNTFAYFTYPAFADHVHVGTRAHGDSTPGNYGAALFALLPGKSIVQFVGWEDTRGLDTYARTVTHECVHKRLYEASHAGVNDNDRNEAGVIVGDRVPDSIEGQVGLDPTKTHSTGFSLDGGQTTENDNEVFCRMTEHSVPLVDPAADWASDGINKGNPPPPNLSQRAVRRTPGYDPNSLNLPNAYAVIP